ncbi:hypothetical protein [Stenotrophomonas phage RAS14]
MLTDDTVVRFNEALRNFSLSVKEMNQAGHNIDFDYKKNRLTILRDGVPVNSLYVENVASDKTV